MALAAVPLAVSLRAVVHYSLEVVQSAESSLVAVVPSACSPRLFPLEGLVRLALQSEEIHSLEVEVQKPSLILSVLDLVAAIALEVQQLILEVVVQRTPCQSSLVTPRQS